MTHPTPPTMSPAHRVEQIGFEIRRIMSDIDRYEKRIKALQLEVQALIHQVQGYGR
ncbi:MAG: site-specific recombinase [bacterium]|nr:site-specific recombinase [bacterium]